MIKFFHKFKNNIIFALIITTLFIFIEQFYRIYNDILIFNLTIKSFLEQFLINLLIISIISRRAILVIYTILSLFVWFQLAHFSYYGTWIFPLEYILFFTQFGEVVGTFTSVLNIMTLPTIFFILLLSFIIYTLNRFEKNRIKIPYLSILLIVFILFLPLRIYLKDDYKKNNRPNFEHYITKNTILTLSNLFGNIIPKKISGNSGLEQPIKGTPLIKNKNPDINIVLIMGESLNREYMSLYNYEFSTTPFLNSLKNNSNFIYKKAISSGVLTDISIPSFFNMIYKPDVIPQILSSNTCLFKMAKENGFNTYFYSSQSQEELKGIKSYICTRHIDILRDGSYFTNNRDISSLDENLSDNLDEIDFSKPSLITLQQRASHTPFLDYIPKDFRPFNKSNTSGIEQNTIDYLNSIKYTDLVIEKIVKKLEEKSKLPTYVIFTSDHATNIGDKNRNGHGILDNESIYKVPFFIYSINTHNNLKNNFDDFSYISHYQVSHIIANLLGYETSYDIFNKKEDYFVCGNDLTGLGGFMKISFDEEGNIIQEDKRKVKKAINEQKH